MTMVDPTGFVLARIAEEEDKALRTKDARALAECVAKLELVKLARGSFLSTLCQDGCGWDALRILANLYADHPDFREEWRR